MKSCEMLEFELGGLHLEPFEKSDFVVMEIGELEDVKVPLMLLSVSQQVIDVASNGGLTYGRVWYRKSKATWD